MRLAPANAASAIVPEPELLNCISWARFTFRTRYCEKSVELVQRSPWNTRTTSL